MSFEEVKNRNWIRWFTHSLMIYSDFVRGGGYTINEAIIDATQSADMISDKYYKNEKPQNKDLFS